jgi:hypothetical protein
MSTEQQLAQWLDQAEARHRHKPAGEARDAAVARTFARIRDESELVALQLPELTREERLALLDEAHLQTFHELGYPGGTDDGIEQAVYDCRVDELFTRLCLRAREQKASPRVRAKLIARRLAARWFGA